MNAQRGFILLISLLFLQICTLLSLYMLQSKWIALHELSQQIQYNQFLNSLMTELNQLEINLQTTVPVCQVTLQSTNAVKFNPLAWWQENGCEVDSVSIHYYYIVELLGIDPCMQVGTNAAEYYRLTVFGNDKIKNLKILLQSIIIRPAHQSLVCAGSKQDIHSGRYAFMVL